MKKENFRNFLAKLEIEIKTTDDDHLDKKQRYELYKEEIKKKLEEQELEITTVEQLKKIEQSNSIASFKKEMEELKGSWREKNKKKVWRGAGITGGFFLLRKLFKKKEEKKEEKEEKKRYHKVGKWLGIGALSVGAFLGVKAIVGEERWNNFKDKIGLGDEKEKDDKEDEDNDQSEQDNEITENLTTEEIKKRNEHITKSIKDSTRYPIKINYGPDKANLEAKGCPKEIGFDEGSQSILFGDKKLGLKTDEFIKRDVETGRSFPAKVDATIIKTKFKKIKIENGEINLTIEATGKARGQEQTKEQITKINKDIFLSIISPYYEGQKTSYKVYIKDGEDKIPLHIKAKA
ncbi:MAG: hypothetical protein PHR61_00165 [Candidatus Absconditabacteria bacterium]|nr:hypothetical protein [Candidatus Absconditabacteria bacterium]